ncbi:MAG: hypothetical protein NT166_21645 [Candidatus Aminicenantes bacterium]|nr:hypothetical protein [Candidatus Aminicenantes bacterium]
MVSLRMLAGKEKYSIVPVLALWCHKEEYRPFLRLDKQERSDNMLHDLGLSEAHDGLIE